MVIALHLLQNFAPSNMNRDDSGEPKDAIFGGVRRARISSQAFKRSMRWSPHFRGPFEAHGLGGLLAVRTRKLPALVWECSKHTELTDDERRAIVEAAARIGKAERTARRAEDGDDAIENDQGDAHARADADDAPWQAQTAQLMFFTADEVAQMTGRLIAIVREKGVDELRRLEGDALVKAIGAYEPHSVDIAMFGRMTTSSPFKNVEAAVQVANAISTHAADVQCDFYTAVDDLSSSSGAGFVGHTFFDSPTYYRYVAIHWERLVQNLQNDADIATMATHALIKAAIFAIPSGMQNRFAAHNLPDLTLIEVRLDNIAINYANAFVKPVHATPDMSLIEASAHALQQYIATINQLYGLQAHRAFLSSVPFRLDGAARCANLDDLLAWLTEQGVRP